MSVFILCCNTFPSVRIIQNCPVISYVWRHLYNALFKSSIRLADRMKKMFVLVTSHFGYQFEGEINLTSLSALFLFQALKKIYEKNMQVIIKFA